MYVLLLVLLVIMSLFYLLPLFLFFLSIQVASVKVSNFIIQILLLAYGINIWSNVVDLIWLQLLYISFG